MSVVSIVQDPRGKGGTASAVTFYRSWMAKHTPQSDELFLDERTRGGLTSLLRWRFPSPAIPRVFPQLQVPPLVAARHAIARQRIAPAEVHVIGASALHGWVTLGIAPTLVWFATTVSDERSPEVLQGRPLSRRIAYRSTQPILSRMEHDVLRGAQRVVAMSTHTADVAIRLGIPTSHVRVVTVPVDTERFSPPPDDSQRRGVLFVGRVHDPRKGFDRLLAAVRASVMLREHGIDVVSPGDPVDTIQWLRWHGRVSDLPLRFGSASVLAMPSRQEGLGIVALEAMACGTPVVARRCGGIDQILHESGGGVVTESEIEFRDTVQEVLSSRTLADSIGSNGRRWIKEHADQSAFLQDAQLFRL